MINHINRHHAFEELMEQLDLLKDVMSRGWVPGDEWDEEVDGEQEVEATPLKAPKPRGGHGAIFRLQMCSQVHALGGGDAGLRAAHSTFARVMRIHPHEHQHDGAAAPEGGGGHTLFQDIYML